MEELVLPEEIGRASERKNDMDYNKILEDIKRKSLDRMAKLDPHSAMHEHGAALNGMYTDRPLDFLDLQALF